MKNILIIIGCGNKLGNSHLLADSFMKGAIEAGHHVNKINLHQNIQGCLGCGACQTNGNHCVIQDSMSEIYPLFMQADVVVLASPLYFWSISSRLKCFIDRLYAISKEDQYPFKETILLMSAGDDHFYTFHQAVSFYRFYTQALGWEDKGMVLAGGCEKKEHQPYVKQDDLDKAYLLGRSLG